MALVVPDLWVREPNLLIPGRKPIGQVMLDEHTLPPGCEVYCPCVGTGQDRIENLITKEVATVNKTNAGVRVGLAPTLHGQARVNIGTSAPHGYGLEFSQHNFTTGDSISVILGGHLASLGTDCGLWSLSDTQNPGSWLDASSGKLRVSAYTSYSTYDITSTGYWTGGMTWSSSGAVQFIDHGQIVDTASRSLSIPASPAFFLFATTSSAGKAPITENYGTITTWAPLWAIAFRRILSAGEIFQISKDPYQFLIPA